ncbi:hypothetical protein H2201_005113 [Coniosporium apollinis]|uniref:Glycosyl hydrolase family 13 catalytic domain-containing protein n=1 Tax=Coniosporium apollinis TaxID=61459 RepID=A0ABQ9NSR2_9PEZI|nr:hypothetical protein H2201_005113 [Coniosporium apollinis]
MTCLPDKPKKLKELNIIIPHPGDLIARLARSWELVTEEWCQTKVIDQILKAAFGSWEKAFVHQIYPASFKDSNGGGLGDIPGIISKLDYIKALGVDLVWACPIYKFPQVDMGYDIYSGKSLTHFEHTLPRSLVKQLIEIGLKTVFTPLEGGAGFDMGALPESPLASRSRSFDGFPTQQFLSIIWYARRADVDKLIPLWVVKVIVSSVIASYTVADQHKWFQEAKKSKDSEFRNFYIWRKPKYDARGEEVERQQAQRSAQQPSRQDGLLTAQGSRSVLRHVSSTTEHGAATVAPIRLRAAILLSTFGGVRNFSDTLATTERWAAFSHADVTDGAAEMEADSRTGR